MNVHVHVHVHIHVHVHGNQQKLLKDIHCKYMYMQDVSENVMKMKNSLLAIFDEMPWAIVQGRWPTLGVTLKIQ